MRDARSAQRILLGRIAGAHGVRGEVLIRTYTEAPENIGAYGPLADESGARSFNVKVVRVTPKGVIARVASVSDRNGAEALKGIELYVDRGRLPAEAKGEYYHADLIGLAAVDAQGKAVGTIVAVQNFGAGDLIEIRLAGSAKTELVPFTDGFVPEVDVKAGRAVVLMPASGSGGRGQTP
ncbi:MAG: ribosome maturation factor RimM [Hyphomicrobiaceae bacterium]|nr:MAG: ribosome maturation factor RimM [Hyphomicrobiaceae bacterium]